MSPRGPDPALQRTQRKQDLLLASHLARGLAAGAFDKIAERADVIGVRVVRVRVWLSSPLVWAAGSAAGALFLGLAVRRAPLGHWLRWGWLAWKLWRGLQARAPSTQVARG